MPIAVVSVVPLAPGILNAPILSAHAYVGPWTADVAINHIYVLDIRAVLLAFLHFQSLIALSALISARQHDSSCIPRVARGLVLLYCVVCHGRFGLFATTSTCLCQFVTFPVVIPRLHSVVLPPHLINTEWQLHTTIFLVLGLRLSSAHRFVCDSFDSSTPHVRETSTQPHRVGCGCSVPGLVLHFGLDTSALQIRPHEIRLLC